MRRKLAGVLLAVGTLAASGSAAPESARTISFLVVTEPANFGLTRSCPDGETEGPIVSTNGKRIGTSHIWGLGKVSRSGRLDLRPRADADQTAAATALRVRDQAPIQVKGG